MGLALLGSVEYGCAVYVFCSHPLNDFLDNCYNGDNPKGSVGQFITERANRKREVTNRRVAL